MTNADVVLSALRSFARADGTVCAPIGEIVLLTDLSEAAVRRALTDLCMAGRIAAGGKEGRNRVFHLPAEEPRATPPSRRSDDDDPPKGGVASLTSTSERAMAQDDDYSVVSPDDNVRRVEEWIKSTGIHFDREEEVEEELFGERGRLFYAGRGRRRGMSDEVVAALRSDEALRNRLLALWRGHRQVGAKLEREQEERLRRRAEPRAPQTAEERDAIAAVLGEREVLREIPVEEPPAEDVLVVLTNAIEDQEERRNGDGPDLTPPDF